MDGGTVRQEWHLGQGETTKDDFYVVAALPQIIGAVNIFDVIQSYVGLSSTNTFHFVISSSN